MLLEKGVSVRIIDGAISNDYRRVANTVLEERPDYLGITASTVSIYNAAKIAQMVKDENPAIITLIGGPHITATPVETMRRFPQFDVGVIGEAERTIVELLSTATWGKLGEIRGIAFRNGDNVVQTERRPYIGNLDELPLPAWHLLPNLTKHYCPPVHTVKRLPATLMVTSRGCPSKCKFCDRSVFGNSLRAYSAEYVMRMIRKLYYDYGIRELQFRDDNFLAFRSRIVELCTLLKKEKLDVVWSLAGRADMVNPETLEMLVNAGCWQIWYGIESGSQRVLDSINKRIKLDKIRETVMLTKKAGISVGGFFMLGLPTETRRDIEDTIRFSQELDIDEAHFTFFTPFPGCELYSTVEQYGEFDDDWHKTSCWNPVFVPHGMTEKQLVRYWKKASFGFYFRPRVILNYVRRLKSTRHAKVYLSGLLALLEAIFVKKYSSERGAQGK